MLDRSFIGKKSKQITIPVEELHIKRFAQAIGDENPLFADAAQAKKSKHGGIIAPPTFATMFGFNDDGPRATDGLDYDYAKLVHGEQEYEYHRPLKPGDRITIQSTVADIFEKEGKAGTMDFLVTEMTGVDQKGRKVFTARSTAIIRP